MTFLEFKSILEASKKLGYTYFFNTLRRLNEFCTDGLVRDLTDKQFIIYRDLMFNYFNALNRQFIDNAPVDAMNKIWCLISDNDDISIAEFSLLELFLHMYETLYGIGGLYSEE